jgi:hypothetical protein
VVEVAGGYPRPARSKAIGRRAGAAKMQGPRELKRYVSINRRRLEGLSMGRFADFQNGSLPRMAWPRAQTSRWVWDSSRIDRPALMGAPVQGQRGPAGDTGL